MSAHSACVCDISVSACAHVCGIPPLYASTTRRFKPGAHACGLCVCELVHAKSTCACACRFSMIFRNGGESLGCDILAYTQACSEKAAKVHLTAWISHTYIHTYILIDMLRNGGEGLGSHKEIHHKVTYRHTYTRTCTSGVLRNGVESLFDGIDLTYIHIDMLRNGGEGLGSHKKIHTYIYIHTYIQACSEKVAKACLTAWNLVWRSVQAERTDRSKGWLCCEACLLLGRGCTRRRETCVYVCQ